MLPQAFDGYPYLVTRIGHSALRSVELLPADWPRERLVDLTRRQALANQLQACLCLGPREAVYLETDGTRTDATHVPTGIVVVDGLVLAEPIPDTPELAARRLQLEAFAAAQNPGGYLVGDGLEGGRPAADTDVERLDGRDEHGIPIGLSRCPACLGLRGDYLDRKGEGNGEDNPQVIRVFCQCENHNRCARCCEPLAGSRLSAWEFNEGDGRVWYLAAYAGLSHRCAA